VRRQREGEKTLREHEDLDVVVAPVDVLECGVRAREGASRWVKEPSEWDESEGGRCGEGGPSLASIGESGEEAEVGGAAVAARISGSAEGVRKLSTERTVEPGRPGREDAIVGGTCREGSDQRLLRGGSRARGGRTKLVEALGRVGREALVPPPALRR